VGQKKWGGAAAELSRPRPRPHAHAHAHATTHHTPHATRHKPQKSQNRNQAKTCGQRPGAPIRPQPSFPSKAPARGPCAKTAAGDICVACPAPAAGGGSRNGGPLFGATRPPRCATRQQLAKLSARCAPAHSPISHDPCPFVYHAIGDAPVPLSAHAPRASSARLRYCLGSPLLSGLSGWRDLCCCRLFCSSLSLFFTRFDSLSARTNLE
jgi:hypothetical protein